MLSVSLTVKNPKLSEIWKHKALDKIAKVEKAVRHSALNVYNGSRDKSPVVTGNFRDSITIKYYVEGVKTMAFIGSNVIYAADLEYNENMYSNSEKMGERTRYVKGKAMHLNQTNANAQWGMFRKSLAEETETFKRNLADALK